MWIYACTCVFMYVRVCTGVRETYRAFPISWESSLPVVASMRAARELKRDRNSGQSLFMPVMERQRRYKCG